MRGGSADHAVTEATALAARYLQWPVQRGRSDMTSALELPEDDCSLSHSTPSRTGDYGVFLRDCLQLAVFLIAFALAYRYGMSFSQKSAAPFWFPDSILLCALLAIPPRRWVLWIAMTLPIRLFSDVARDIPVWFLYATFAIDAVKALLTATLLRRFVRNPLRLETIREFVSFGLVAVLLVPALGAFAGAAVRQALGHDYWMSWDQWFMGDALAQLVITPAILYWILGARAQLPRWNRARVAEGGLLVVTLSLTAHLAANTGEGSVDFLQARFYAPVPLLFWAAIRFGMAGASGAVTLVAVVVTHAALHGRGPFAGHSPAEMANALQNFLLLRAAPLYLVAVSVDQRLSAERSLRESDSRFRDMANNAPVLMFLVDAHKRIVFLNRTWLHFTGRTLEQEVGDGWVAGLHPEDAPGCLATYNECFDARVPFELEYRLRRHDGEYRWILSRGSPRTGLKGNFLGYIGSSIDITDHNRAEEATRALTHSQRLIAIGELTALIAHEIKQPLCAMLVNTGAIGRLLKRAELPLVEMGAIVGDLRADVVRIEATISRICAFVRNREFKLQRVDLNTVVTDVLRFIASESERRRVHIRSQLSFDLPKSLGDSAHLQQVLLNLIVNAMDALSTMPEAARFVCVFTKRLDASHLEVGVCDCGRGIGVDVLPRLFDPFFTTRAEGVGLGLSIARSIVSAHRGKIWAVNNPNGGATFYFSVPIADADTESRAESLRSSPL